MNVQEKAPPEQGVCDMELVDLEFKGHYLQDSPTAYKAEGKLFYRIGKRIFDFISSLILGIILLIPCMIISLIIMAADHGNPFYVHKRIGYKGRQISIVKFRSMKKNADDLQSSLTAEQLEQYKKEYKIDNDPRLIPYGIGDFIRRTSIDELPQIFVNICILGNMSVVGPRPILQEELETKYTPEEQKLFLSVKPGLTGYWQAYARNNAGYESGKRQEMELYYIKNRSAVLDIKILFKTIETVIKKTGAQ